MCLQSQENDTNFIKLLDGPYAIFSINIRLYREVALWWETFLQVLGNQMGSHLNRIMPFWCKLYFESTLSKSDFHLLLRGCSASE